MPILVTGANGLVGSAVVKRLLDDGHEVKALCRPGADMSLLADVIERITLAEGDVMDILSLENALEGIDTVVHTAAVVSFAPRDRAEMYRINVEGTTNVVNACLGAAVNALVFVSSIAALGRPTATNTGNQTIDINETQQWQDSSLNSHYAKSKYLAECEVWRGEAEGLNVAVVNPSVILGEGDWTRSSTQLFRYVHDGNKFYTLGQLNYVDINDLTEVISRLIRQKVFGERYIVSAGTITYKDFFDKIAAAFRKSPPSILLGHTLTEVLWRVEALRSYLTGSSPLITKETAKTARTNFRYRNDKVKQQLEISFTPIDETIHRVTDFLRK